MGFQFVMGVPQQLHGLFHGKSHRSKWMIFVGYPCDSGNLYIPWVYPHHIPRISPWYQYEWHFGQLHFPPRNARSTSSLRCCGGKTKSKRHIRVAQHRVRLGMGVFWPLQSGHNLGGVRGENPWYFPFWVPPFMEPPHVGTWSCLGTHPSNDRSASEASIQIEWASARVPPTPLKRRGGAAGAGWIPPNASKLTRSWDSKEWQMDSPFLFLWVVVHGCSQSM